MTARTGRLSGLGCVSSAAIETLMTIGAVGAVGAVGREEPLSVEPYDDSQLPAKEVLLAERTSSERVDPLSFRGSPPMWFRNSLSRRRICTVDRCCPRAKTAGREAKAFIS